MGKKNFLFKEKVTISPEEEPKMYTPSPMVKIELAQNGFELCYNGKEYVATDLDEAMDMTKKWLEKAMKEQK